MLMHRPTYVTLSGDLDVYRAADIADALEPACENAHAIVDLSDVHYLDCTALSLFVRMRNRRAAHGFAPAMFIGLTPKFQRLFYLVGLDMRAARVQRSA